MGVFESGAVQAPPLGFHFWTLRVMAVASLALLGVLGPLLSVWAGVMERKPALLGLGVLGLVLSLGLGFMLAVGQARLRRTMAALAARTGLTHSAQPDPIPGLAHHALSGEWGGYRVSIGFENLTVHGTGQFVAGQRLYGARSRQFLVASLWRSTGVAPPDAVWCELPAQGSGVPPSLGLDRSAWLRLRGLGARKFLLGGPRLALAWDGGLTAQDFDRVVHGLGWLVNQVSGELGVKLESMGSCPFCAVALPRDPRYPRAVCPACVRRACDENGLALDFFNRDAGGGYLALYRGSSEEYPRHDCYIDGRHCRADEAKWGGIVVQMTDPADARASVGS